MATESKLVIDGREHSVSDLIINTAPDGVGGTLVVGSTSASTAIIEAASSASEVLLDGQLIIVTGKADENTLNFRPA